MICSGYSLVSAIMTMYLQFKVLFQLFNAELQRHLLTVESGKCAVHSAVVGVSYKTVIEFVCCLFHKHKIFRQAT